MTLIVTCKICVGWQYNFPVSEQGSQVFCLGFILNAATLAWQHTHRHPGHSSDI